MLNLSPRGHLFQRKELEAGDLAQEIELVEHTQAHQRRYEGSGNDKLVGFLPVEEKSIDPVSLRDVRSLPDYLIPFLLTVEPDHHRLRRRMGNGTELAIVGVNIRNACVLQPVEILTHLLCSVHRFRDLVLLQFTTVREMDQPVLQLFGSEDRIGRLFPDSRSYQRQLRRERLRVCPETSGRIA
jgi:hypothetical protein